jgi:hypothetical protein
LKQLFIALALTTAACGNGDRGSQSADPFGRDADPALAPVTDTDAKTVKELRDAGYWIVDQREAGCYAGSDVACDGFDALYFGKENNRDEESLAEFACPGTKAPVDTWKCRPLDPPYVANGGFNPVVQDSKQPAAAKGKP